MCGIAGYYSLSGKISEQDLRIMAHRIGHRGPDAEGFYSSNPIGLAHKRLSIIDLSEAANQPMTSRCGRYVMIFNGEIYNYLALREELSEKHHIPFKTQSDTETLLEGFTVWGTDIFAKVCGMFALIIYDTFEKRLIISRDRLGIKPLFYYHKENEYVFASEIKSIIALNKVKEQNTLNYEAVNSYLHLGYIPQPHTIYSHIFKFPSGYWAEIKDGQIRFENYWQTSDIINSHTIDNEKEAKEKLQNLLKFIIKEHLICDVPFGCLLSGGIDSSLVTALAKEVSDKPLHTFSIGFEEAKYNESIYARQVATHLGTIHHELFVTERNAIELIPHLIDIYDEPYADSSAIPTYLVSKLTKEYVTMALSGDGGDELFLGYGAYRWAKRLNNPLIKLARHPVSCLLSQMGNRYKRAATVLNFPDNKTIKSHIFSQEQYLFSREEIKYLIKPELYSDFSIDENFQNSSRRLSVIEQQALFDINYYLKDDLLVKVDRASMQHSLEVRVPLLDHRLLEFALNLNPKLRLKGKTGKYLLKQLLYDYVPKEIFNRPKWGFSIPLEKWMKKELKPYISDLLSEKIVQKHNIVNYNELKKYIKLFEDERYAYLYNRIWALAVLHDFFEKK